MSTKFRPITHIITGSGPSPVNPWPPTGSAELSQIPDTWK